MSNLLYLVRHAENLANLTKEFSYKKVDLSLTSKGRLQAGQTAVALAGIDFNAIYSSPLRRAVETAEIIAASRGIPITVVENFREINVGRLEDTPPTSETWGLHNRIIGQWLSGNKKVGFPGGENYFSLWKRFQTGLKSILDGRENEKILLVGHGGMFTITMREFCPQMEPSFLSNVENHNCSISVIETAEVNGMIQGSLIKWADCSHLSGEAAVLVSGLLEGSMTEIVSARIRS